MRDLETTRQNQPHKIVMFAQRGWCTNRRVMRTGLVLAVLAASVVACLPRPKTQTQVAAAPVAATARPFTVSPTVALMDHAQVGPMYRVQIVAEITRDVMPTDDLAIVVSVGDLEVGRYPVVGRFAGAGTRVKQEIEIPLGDYHLDFAYQGEIYAGMPFRLAQVPVWGGRKALQLREHPGTRVSLREGKLWVGRWWANDGPPQAWIVEWVNEGRVITTTSGREDKGMPTNAASIVSGAAGAYMANRLVHNTIWAYGEEYPLPPEVATTPGLWAARVVHGGSSPVAVIFTVLPGGRLAEQSSRRVAAVGWEPSWSKVLEQRALAITEVDRLTAKLPQLGASQPFDEQQPSDRPEPMIRISTAAVRALFRSRALAEAWWQYEQLNKPVAMTSSPMAAISFPKSSKRTAGLGSGRRVGAKDQNEQRTKMRALRTQIEQLIKTNGGPWQAPEFPRS
jgi:hypothetical protein